MKKIILLALVFLGFQSIAQVNTWTQVASPPSSYTARNHPVTFAIDGFGYLLTGFSGQFLHSDFYKYDAANDSWSTLPNFPGGARGFAYGVSHMGKGYVGFGITQTQQGIIYLNDLWEFDPSNNSWQQLASCPGSGRRHPAFLAADNKLYLGCGDNSSANLKDWWEYDIATDTWTQKASLPGPPRHHPYFFTLNDEPYVGFGHNGSNSQGPIIYKDLYRYNQSSDTWTRMADLPAQGRVAGTQFSFNNKGYLLSGQGEDHNNLNTGEFWEYNPLTDTWASMPPHPGTARWAPGSFVIGNVVYFTSGESGLTTPTLTNEKDMWKFQFADFPASVSSISNDIVSLYPNPVNAALVINSNEKVLNVEVYNSLGVKISRTVNMANERVTIDCSSLSVGNYFVKIETKKGFSVEQFVVSH